MSFVADRRLYLTKAKDRVVEETDPEAAYLFVVPGHVISEADMIRFDLFPQPEVEDALAFHEDELDDDYEDDTVFQGKQLDIEDK